MHQMEGPAKSRKRCAPGERGCPEALDPQASTDGQTELRELSCRPMRWTSWHFARLLLS